MQLNVQPFTLKYRFSMFFASNLTLSYDSKLWLLAYSYQLLSFAIYHKRMIYWPELLLFRNVRTNVFPPIRTLVQVGNDQTREREKKNTHHTTCTFHLIAILFTATWDHSYLRPASACFFAVVVFIRIPECFSTLQFLCLSVFNIWSIFLRRIYGWSRIFKGKGKKKKGLVNF